MLFLCFRLASKGSSQFLLCLYVSCLHYFEKKRVNSYFPMNEFPRYFLHATYGHLISLKSPKFPIIFLCLFVGSVRFLFSRNIPFNAILLLFSESPFPLFISIFWLFVFLKFLEFFFNFPLFMYFFVILIFFIRFLRFIAFFHYFFLPIFLIILLDFITFSSILPFFLL